MNTWRSDLSIIREIITGTSPQNWRSDFIAIAQYFGYNPQSWREAVTHWSDNHGISALNWRDGIMNISKTLIPETPPPNWREALWYIRLYYEDNPPELLRLLDSEGKRLFDSLERALYVRG